MSFPQIVRQHLEIGTSDNITARVFEHDGLLGFHIGSDHQTLKGNEFSVNENGINLRSKLSEAVRLQSAICNYRTETDGTATALTSHSLPRFSIESVATSFQKEIVEEYRPGYSESVNYYLSRERFNGTNWNLDSKFSQAIGLVDGEVALVLSRAPLDHLGRQTNNVLRAGGSGFKFNLNRSIVESLGLVGEDIQWQVTSDRVVITSDHGRSLLSNTVRTTLSELTESLTVPKHEQSPPGHLRRDVDIEQTVKRHHGYNCQFCDQRLFETPSERYAEIGMLVSDTPDAAQPHQVAGNMLVLCPNHRVDLSHGMASVNPVSMKIQHVTDPSLDGRELYTASQHPINPLFAHRHLSELYQGKRELQS